MNDSQYQCIPKRELAESQLNVALRLYLSDEEYPSVITLAGAAEEVLGKIALDNGHEPALNRKLTKLVTLHKRVWGKEAKEGDYAQLRNKARNEMKHIYSGKDVDLDYEEEATKMLSRALENYRLCFGRPHKKQYVFTKKRIENWRIKYETNV